MKNFKKIAALFLAIVMVGSTFAGCGKGSSKKEEETTVDKSSWTPEEYYGVDGWDAQAITSSLIRKNNQMYQRNLHQRNTMEWQTGHHKRML